MTWKIRVCKCGHWWKPPGNYYCPRCLRATTKEVEVRPA